MLSGPVGYIPPDFLPCEGGHEPFVRLLGEQTSHRIDVRNYTRLPDAIPPSAFSRLIVPLWLFELLAAFAPILTTLGPTEGVLTALKPLLEDEAEREALLSLARMGEEPLLDRLLRSWPSSVTAEVRITGPRFELVKERVRDLLLAHLNGSCRWV